MKRKLMITFLIFSLSLGTATCVFAAGRNYIDATEINVNSSISGTTPYNEGNWGENFYKFKTSSMAAKYTLKLVHTGGDGEIEASLSDSDYNYVMGNEWGSIRLYENRGASTGYDLRRNSVYYIKVGSFSENDYIMVMQEQISKPTKPSIKRITKKGKSLNIRWSRSVRAQSYKLAIKKGNGKWKVYTTSGRSKAIKNLKKGKVYKVKVRGLLKYNGKTYQSKWSKIKKIKM